MPYCKPDERLFNTGREKDRPFERKVEELRAKGEERSVKSFRFEGE